MRHTEPTAQTLPPSDLVPLSHLVLEGLAESVLADLEDVLVDDIGRRCTTREIARRLLAEDAEAKAEMEAHWLREREKTVRLVAEAQASIRRGVPAPEGLEHLSAAQLLSAGAAAERLDAAGERHDEYASGDVFYHPIQNEGEE